MDFQTLTKANISRVKRWHGNDWLDRSGTGHWSGGDWANAMQGEAGEAGNVVKKLRRVETGLGAQKDPGQLTLLAMLEKEIGDTAIYLDLLCTYYGLSLEDCIKVAFNQVSEREGFPERV